MRMMPLKQRGRHKYVDIRGLCASDRVVDCVHDVNCWNRGLSGTDSENYFAALKLFR